MIWRASDSCISRPLINSLRSQQKYQTKPKLNQAFNYIFWTNHHGIYAKFPCSTCFQAKPRCYRRWLVRLGRLREPRKRDRVWRWLCPFGTQPFPIGSRRAPMGRWSTDPWMYASLRKKQMDPVMLALPSLFSKKDVNHQILWSGIRGEKPLSHIGTWSSPIPNLFVQLSTKRTAYKLSQHKSWAQERAILVTKLAVKSSHRIHVWYIYLYVHLRCINEFSHRLFMYR